MQVWSSNKDAKTCRIVVLISGNGSNLQAIMDHCTKGSIPAEVTAVISNVASAFGLTRARQAGITSHCLDHRDFANRLEYDDALAALVEAFHPDLVVLAGFMRILGRQFIDRFAGRLVNIHPSLLPRYPGLDTHERAIADGVREHGASVHFVTQDLDAGPIIIQGRVNVMKGDSAEILAARVHDVEHRIYLQAVGWFASGRLALKDGVALLDGKPLTD